MLGKSVTLVDKSSLAGLLDPAQRDGLLATAWLLVSEVKKPTSNRTVTLQFGPVSPADHPVPEHKIAIPITITTTGCRPQPGRPVDLGRTRSRWALL